MLDDAAAAEATGGQPFVGAKKGVVEDVHVAGHPVFTVGVTHFQKVAAAVVRLGLAAATTFRQMYSGPIESAALPIIIMHCAM